MMNFDLFGENKVFEKLSKIGDPLEKLNALIDWELFRPTLNQLLKKSSKGPGGRPPYDYVLLFKILILQRYYNLSDDQTEYTILDRLSFRRFLDISEYTTAIPDAKTIWLFKDTLSKTDDYQELFLIFERTLEAQGIISHEGTMVDASFIECPRQRNTKKENDLIKQGETPLDWKDAKRHQKDTDARWTQKNNQNYYGYKNHVAVDMQSKLIISNEVTSASVHDSQIFDVLLDEKTQVIFADSAYMWNEIPDNVRSEVITHAVRNHPINEEQKKINSLRASIRCRVEHVFGFIENSMHGSTFKGTTLVRAKLNGMLTSLTYNLFRVGQIKKAAQIQREKCVQF